MVKNPLLPIEMESFDIGTLGAAYQVVNTNGFGEACCLLRITNDGSTDVTISYDGTTDHDYLQAGGTLQISTTRVSTPPSLADRANFRKGTKIYVKGTGSSGYLYVSAYYRPLGE